MSAAAITISPAQLADLEAIAEHLEEKGSALRAEIRHLQGLNTALYGALCETLEHVAAAQRDARRTGLDQPHEVLEPLLEEIGERLAAAYHAASLPLMIAEMRVDLDGRDDVVVLAEARERLRAAGRRA